MSMDFVASLFPHTASGWVVQIVISFIASYFLLSLMEYLLHRFVMHGVLSDLVYKVAPFIKTLHEDHLKHHQTYSTYFNKPTIEEYKDLNLKLGLQHSAMGTVCLLPYFIVTLLLVGALPTIIFCLFALMHNLAWNFIHAEMHDPRNRQWSHSRPFKFLAEYHYLHHHHPSQRFNIVCPLFDWLVGSVNNPTVADLHDIERLGFLK